MRERLYGLLFSTPPRVAFARPWPGTRRGLVLWLMCWAVGLVGAANYIGTTLPGRTQRALEPMLAVMPSTDWGWLFLAVALFSAFTSFCHFDRDHLGYALMAGLTGFWGAAWVLGFVFDWTEDGDADWRILGSSAIWVIWAATLYVCRGFDKDPLYPSGTCARWSWADRLRRGGR